MNKKLENRTAIVTGAGSGIGRAIAHRFAHEGASVVIADIIDEAGKLVESEIREKGGKALYVKTDVSSSSSVKDMVNKAAQEFGSIDILVNNAGILIKKPIQEMTEEEWDKVLDINLKGAFLCTKYCVDYMVEKKKGRIINMASMGAKIGLGHDCSYCASKGGMISLATALAKDLGSDGITVNAIAPGVISTPMADDEDTQGKDFKENALKRLTVGRFGTPEDVAATALFLASDDADHITGQTIFVDGGYTTN